MMEVMKEKMNKYLQEIQKNTNMQSSLKRKKISLNDKQENTNKQVNEINKTVQDMEVKIDTIKKKETE